MDEDENYWHKSVGGFDFNEDTQNMPSIRNDQKLFLDDNVSEISYELPPSNEIPLHLIISEQELRMVLEEQSLKETPLPKTISIEDELKILRRKAQESYHAPPPASTVITKILLRKPYSLECFRAMQEKESLLDEAIATGNGDAILTIVLFLLKTLKRKYFNGILQVRPTAIRHYVNYLLARGQIAECTDFLTMLGKYNAAAMLQFEFVMKLCKNPDTKKQKLNKIHNEFFGNQNSTTVHPFYTNIVTNYVSLLEWQLSEKIHNPKLTNILDSSVLESLYYACMNHKWTASSGHDHHLTGSTFSSLSRPQKFADTYKISQSQFDWIALNERAQKQAWLNLEHIFERKSWHSLKTSKTFSINVPLDRAILQLSALDAPVAILNQFLAHIDDPQRRLALARKLNAGKSIVDALIELKNRPELEMYLETLQIGNEVRFYGENALKNLKSKWNAESLKILKN